MKQSIVKCIAKEIVDDIAREFIGIETVSSESLQDIAIVLFARPEEVQQTDAVEELRHQRATRSELRQDGWDALPLIWDDVGAHALHVTRLATKVELLFCPEREFRKGLGDPVKPLDSQDANQVDSGDDQAYVPCKSVSRFRPLHFDCQFAAVDRSCVHLPDG